jgi:hypothetical protein
MPVFNISIKGRFTAYTEDDAIDTINLCLEDIGFTVNRIETDNTTMQTKLKQEVKKT